MTPSRALPALLGALFALTPVASERTMASPVRLTQPDGSSLILERPAERIVSLAPSITEQVFAAGAGDLLVAVSEYSDYPPRANNVPRIGDAFRFDLERILSIRPDLVIGWESGNPESALAGLEALGIKLWRTEVRSLAGIANQLDAIGRATGRGDSASAAAERLRERLRRLSGAYRDAAPLSYFFQVSERPLYTVNGEHLISRGLAVCGADNAFASLSSLAPQVSTESVLHADPDVLVAPEIPGAGDPLAHWRQWPRLKAVRRDAFLLLPADQINRATPRLLDSVELACKLFDEIRTGSTAGVKQKTGNDP